MTLPTSLISRSTKTLSFATISFKTRTSFMAPLTTPRPFAACSGEGSLPGDGPTNRTEHSRPRHLPRKNQPPRRQGRPRAPRFWGIFFWRPWRLGGLIRLLALAAGARVPVAAEAVEATLFQELAQVVARDIGL